MNPILSEAITEKDAMSLYELALQAIAKRPAYKRMFTEVRKRVMITDYDDDGNVIDSREEYIFSDVMRSTTFSSVIVKAIVSAMNDRCANSIYVPSYLGKMCAARMPARENFEFDKCHNVLTDGDMDYCIIDKCLEEGKLTKEMLTGLSGLHIGTMVYEAIGEDRIYQAVLNSSNAVTSLSDDMLYFISKYSPADAIMKVSWNLLKSGNCPADMYEDVIGGLSQQIKSDAKAAGVISNGQARSKVLPFLIGLRLKEMYNPQN